MKKLLCAMFFIAVFAPNARAETDWVQLATNMIWCYQEKGHVSEEYPIGWVTYITTDGTNWSAQQQPATNISRSRDEYVRDIQIAAVRSDAAMAEEIYRMCQRHNGEALKYVQGATASQWVDAVVHAAACYDASQPTNSPRVRTAGELFQSPVGPIACVR